MHQLIVRVLLFHELSGKSVILHEEIILSQANTESVVGSGGTKFAIFFQPPWASAEKVVVNMGEESPDGLLEQVVVGDYGDTDEEAGRKTHIEGEDVDVVSGALALAISGFEFHGFIFSEIVPEN